MRSADSTEFFTDVLSGVKVQLADHSIVGRKQLSETLKLCTYENWATMPVGYCPSMRLSLFGHTARMPDETDARSTGIITASPSENWRRPPGRPRTTWMTTIQQDLRSNNLSLDEAITVAQNHPLWRLMSAFGATHP